MIAAQLCVTVVDISDAEKEAYAKLAGPYVLNLLYRGSWKRAVLEYSGGIFTRSCTMWASASCAFQQPEIWWS